MLMFAGKVHHLRHFCFGHFVGENAAFTDAVVMDMQHDSGRRFVVLVEELLQHVHHELHRGVVVIQNQHAIEARTFGLRPGLGDDRGPGRARIAAPLAVVVGQPQGPKGFSFCRARWFGSEVANHGYFGGLRPGLVAGEMGQNHPRAPIIKMGSLRF
jgi:hypothetical protein